MTISSCVGSCFCTEAQGSQALRARDPVTPQKDCMLGRIKALLIYMLKAPSNGISPERLKCLRIKSPCHNGCEL